MDYGNANCSNMFTKRQVAVMRYNLIHLRTGLSVEKFILPLIPFEEDFVLFPNPISNTLRFFSMDADGTNVTLELYDELGRMVYQQTLPKYTYTIQFDQIGVAVGKYRAQIKVDDAVVFQKTIVKSMK